MKRKIIFISDFFLDDFIGGAALNDEEAVGLLSEKFQVVKLKSRYVYPGYIEENKDNFFIISNFFHLPRQIIQALQKCKYLIYAHDYKFVDHTNPAAYENLKVPEKDLINVDFYEASKAIICQSSFQKKIYDSNLNTENKTVNFSGNLWGKTHLNLMKKLKFSEKEDSSAILSSPYPQKGTQKALEYCKQNHKKANVIASDNYQFFLEKMSKNKEFLFFPSTPETLSRTCVEAKLMDINVTTNKLVGAMYESWFSKDSEYIHDYLLEKRNSFSDFIDSLMS